MMPTSAPPPVSRRELVVVALRHKFKAIFVFCSIVALGAGLLFLWPRSYESEAKLFIRLGRSSVALDPTATVGQVIAINESREREINSVLEVLKSRELCERVVEQLGEEELLDAPPTTSPLVNDWLQRARRAVLGSGDDRPEMRRELAVLALKGSIQATVAKDSNVIRMVCEARSPELAQRILQSYIAAYDEHHLKLHDTSGSFDFFAREAERAKTELTAATTSLQDAKSAAGVTSVEGQRRIYEDQFLGLERDVVETESHLAAAKSKIEAMLRTRPDLQSQTDFSQATAMSETAVDNMRAELFKLEIEERRLLAQFGEGQPKLEALKEQVAQTKLILAAQELLAERSKVVEAEARLERTRGLIEESRQRLVALNEQEVKLRDFEQRLEIARANYQKYANNLEQARINAALADEQISDVELAQAPSLGLKHVAPRRAVGLLVVLACAAMLSFAAVFASEYFDDRVRKVAEIEQLVQAPVILNVPRSRRERQVAI
ncbi:MAG: hypothetical protein KDA59_18110, partial [Planctomycetales bacterium]|nr:hypothetical protein [Planctomycetales bacterium]